MPLDLPSLTQVVAELAGRPGHEKTRTNVWKLLTDGLDMASADIDFEKRLVHGRMDALIGNTVFEFKRDLRLTSEQTDLEVQLTMYLAPQNARTGVNFIGIGTDGATSVAYELANGSLVEIQRHATRRDNPRALLDWMDGALAPRADIEPAPEAVKLHLGRESVAYGRARRELAELWRSVAARPDVTLYRELWSERLQMVYGTRIESDELWFQHTYLTIVAKTMATAAVGFTPIPPPDHLLSGRPFEDAAIYGAVESDFFNWVLEAAGGDVLVTRIAQLVARFRLRAVKTDVLKTLYESLIDPGTRHELGEYYTPDWLAARICARAIDQPLAQRVLDPSCGSGTFLFHAVTRFREEAAAANWSAPRILEGCCTHVFGIDVHPVATIIARVTYLLALGDLVSGNHPPVSIPVYLGDSMQWNVRRVLVEGEITIGTGTEEMTFPSSVAKEPAEFDKVLAAMLEQSEQGVPAEGFANWLDREYAPGEADRQTLTTTYGVLKKLYDEGRDHIWGYIARNVSRPVWLSSTGQRAHVIIGNPPWLAYRHMSSEMQERFKAECQRRGMWTGGKVATHADLSGYFFARCVELYLQARGVIAFVMPYSSMSRLQFEGFRSGWWGVGRRLPGEKGGRKRKVDLVAEAKFEDAWTFDEHVKPLFPVPSCVLFARNVGASTLPTTVSGFRGTLRHRDASAEEADVAITGTSRPWPAGPSTTGGSPYRELFHQGATMVPRILCVVERVAAGTLGGDASAPIVRSRRTKQEKPPWKALEPLQMAIEREFVRPLYLGESIGPFRLFESVLGVVPWDGTSILVDSGSAQRSGLPRLANWMKQAELLWEANRGPATTMSFVEQLDYFGKLSAQLPVPALRIVFAGSGTQPAAVVLRTNEGIVEHGLYWATIGTESEGHYLTCVLNSETARQRTSNMQSLGQWGARHFDKVVFELLIPLFDPSIRVHAELAVAGADAEKVAATVDVTNTNFVRARARIREALKDDGVAGRIEALVQTLLGPP